MREVAARAGVALGLAYYYFKSKDAIVHTFYQRAKDDLAPRLDAAHREKTLSARLEGLIETKLAYFAPNRRFLGALLGHASDPSNPLSPFSDASREIRDADIAQFDRALTETKTSVPKDLAPHVGRMLWFYQMGLILFWIHDRSAQQTRTRELLAASLPIVVTLIKLANLPLLRPARRRVLNVLSILSEA